MRPTIDEFCWKGTFKSKGRIACCEKARRLKIRRLWLGGIQPPRISKEFLGSPTPVIPGPRTLCSGSSATFTATVNGDFSCFHHKIRWTIPPGWSASATLGGKVTITAPSSLTPTTGRIMAQVWYDVRNEFGPAGFIDVLTGPPPGLNPGINGPQSLRKNAQGTWTVALGNSNTKMELFH